MKAIGLAFALLAVGALCLTGCETAPKSTQGRASLDTEVQNTIQTALNQDPGLQEFFDKSAGYAVFPRVGKGAFVAGGAFGRGELFENKQLVGYCTLTQASVGFQAGGEQYSELIFLQTPANVNAFKAGSLSLTGEATAVALTAGASAKTNFSNGVAVFTMQPTGLMVAAAVGGQKFSFEPVGTTTATVRPAMQQTR
jgi:lipid-binding SYLF domain-containing protein